jgi:hypothetical protein
MLNSVKSNKIRITNGQFRDFTRYYIMNMLERMMMITAKLHLLLRTLSKTNPLRKFPGTSLMNGAEVMKPTFSMERCITVVKYMGS